MFGKGGAAPRGGAFQERAWRRGTEAELSLRGGAVWERGVAISRGRAAPRGGASTRGGTFWDGLGCTEGGAILRGRVLGGEG